MADGAEGDGRARGGEGRRSASSDLQLRRPDRQDVADRCRHALAPRCLGHVLLRARRRRRQRRDDLDLRDPHLGRDARPTRSTTPCARCTPPSGSTPSRARPSSTAAPVDDRPHRRGRRRHRPGRRRHAPPARRARLPASSAIRFLASARSAGSTLPWRGADVVVEDAATADLTGIDIALFSAGGATSKALAPKFAAAGAVVVDNSSAWRMDPDVPLVVSEVNPHDAPSASEGHHRQPELHDHGGDAGAASRCTTRPDCAGSSSAATRRSRARAGRCRGARHPDARRGSTQDVTALVHDGASVALPAPKQVRARPSPSTSSRWPARSSTTARSRPTRSRSSATRAARSSGIPELLVSRHLRAGAGLHRALAVDQRRVRPCRSRSSAPPSCSPVLPGSSSPRCRPRCRRPARTRRTSAGSARTRASPDGRGLALFVSNDNLRKGAALNTIQIAELVAAALPLPSG